MNGFRYYLHKSRGWEYKSKSGVMIHYDEQDPNDLSGDEFEKDNMAVDEDNLGDNCSGSAKSPTYEKAHQN
ncbi:hypothetical protein A2U01_0083796, partial [Trifolium medium]|nr:hypothetical protein [Trifolium medium]